MNRKADMTLKEVVELVIVALVVIFIVSLTSLVWNLFGNDRKDATQNNFDALVERIKNMPAETKQDYDIWLSSGYVVASFADKYDVAGDEYLKAPDTCKHNCLCLCAVSDGRCEGRCEDMSGWVEFTEKIHITGLGEIRPVCLYKTITGGKARVSVTLGECRQRQKETEAGLDNPRDLVDSVGVTTPMS